MLGHEVVVEFMNTPQARNPRSYKLSFIINTAVGGILLLLTVIAGVFEGFFPVLRGQLVWGFVPATMVCWFIASLHYSKYLSLSR
jgi:hypothetical protein